MKIINCLLQKIIYTKKYLELNTDKGKYNLQIINGQIICDIFNNEMRNVGLINLKENTYIKIFIHKNKLIKIIIPIEYHFNNSSDELF